MNMTIKVRVTYDRRSTKGGSISYQRVRACVLTPEQVQALRPDAGRWLDGDYLYDYPARVELVIHEEDPTEIDA